MTTTYTKTLITDEATDDDSPITETLMQDKAQSINYLIDAVTAGGGNSEIPDLSNNTPADVDIYISSWVQITNTNTNDFAHGLGRTPTVVLPMIATGGTPPMYMMGFDDDTQFATACRVTVIDGTNVTVDNDSGNTVYAKIVCF